MTNMAMRADPARGYMGRTYRFYTGPTIHPFGHGLSPTRSRTRRRSSPSASPAAAPPPPSTRRPIRTAPPCASRTRGAEGLNIPVHVDVKNVGDRDGAHTVLVYAALPAAAAGSGHGAPVRQLVAFEKVHVPAGGVARVEMGIHVRNGLSVADRNGVRRIPVGEHSLMIGALIRSVTLGVEQLGV